MKTPRFAVVGRPNKGKSSIVATLARDDSVLIETRSGSTRRAQTFPMSVDGEVLYELVDTPGIQRARRALEWLQSHSSDASDRPRTVARFVQQFRGSGEFTDECELLDPITEGAGIIYVVDGSVPFSADYEAEMEILRWSGRPSLALINPIDNDHYAPEWQAGLQQYFRTVRPFNAARAEFEKQLELLELFGHLDPDWREPMEKAIRLLTQERAHQLTMCSSIIADSIFSCVQLEVRQKLLPGMPESTIKEKLFQRYRESVARQETQCRRQVEEVYHFHNLQRQESELELENSDLFDVDNWYLWGLNKRSLAAVAASAGALVGGTAGATADGLAGGLLGGSATLFAGTLGAISGSLGVWKYADEIAQWRIRGIPTGGREMIVGPSRNLNFPFVLLGRALLHIRLINQRTHADRSHLSLKDDLLSPLDDRSRRKLGKLFALIRQRRKLLETRKSLAEQVLNIISQSEPDQVRSPD